MVHMSMVVSEGPLLVAMVSRFRVVKVVSEMVLVGFGGAGLVLEVKGQGLRTTG